VPDGARIETNGDIVVNGPNRPVVEHVEPCQHDPVFVDAGTPSDNRPRNAQAPSSCPADPNNGNFEFVAANPNNNSTAGWFNAVEAQWGVPQAPSNFQLFGGMETFLWTGLDSRSSCTLVLQPVLQFGAAASMCSAGGQFWELENYYIDINGNGYCQQVAQINPGDTITGIVEVDSSQPCETFGFMCSWIIYSSAKSGPSASFSVASLLVRLDTAIYASAEAYHIKDCSYYPAGGGAIFAAEPFQPVRDSSGNIQVFQFGANPNIDLSPSQAPPPQGTLPLAPGLPSNCTYGIQLLGANSPALLFALKY
jgi:hypothetical protein